MRIQIEKTVAASGCVLAVCALAASFFAAGSITSIAAAAEDAWPCYAHDAALTGRTSLVGDIVAPRESWSISLAGTELEIEIIPAPGKRGLRIADDTQTTNSPQTFAAPGKRMLDIDGSGAEIPVDENHESRWAKILPDVRGMQQVRWDQTRKTDEICHLELIAYDEGRDRPRTVWRSEPEGTVFAPLCVVYDIDGDGVQEICVALHYRVLIFDGETGRKETELRFHSSRAYGWFGLADVDLDGQMELITLSDFQSHFDVLSYDAKKPEADRLSVMWRRDIETNIQDRIKWPQIGPRPVVNVTGDARPEIVVNLYNDQLDGAWHSVILDASTGETIVDLPNRYTHGNADVNGDGDAEIFCAETDGVFVPEFGRIEIVDFADGAPTVVWSQENAAFASTDLPNLGPTWASGAAMGMRHVLLAESTSHPASHPAFSVMTRGDSTSVAVMRFDASGGVNELWKVEGFGRNVEPIALDSRGDSVAALLRVQSPAEEQMTLAAHDAAPTVVTRSSLGNGGYAPIIAQSSPNGTMRVYVEGPAENIFAIEAPTNPAGEPRIVWRRPGRGMGNTAQPGCVSAVDLDDDGSPEIIAAGRAQSGAATVVAYHADGSTYWRQEFAQTPGARPVHNVGTLSYWWPGRFRTGGAVDLFVNTRRGLMHSDEGHLLDGRTGELVWTHDKAIAPNEFAWGYTGVPIAVADMNRDERDELVNLYPVCFWIADGATGELLHGKDLATRKVVPAWAAYGEPLVWDFNGDGEKEVLLDSVYILALLDANGAALWHGKTRRDYPTGASDDNVGETTGVRHALIDFDGDGRFEIASGGYKDGVRAIDPNDGTVLWSLEAPTPTGIKCAAANIDGRPGDELLYVAGDEIVAVTGNRDRGRVLWTWRCGAALSLPAIADVDGDGLAEIIVQSVDGVVHCIDGPAK